MKTLEKKTKKKLTHTTFVGTVGYLNQEFKNFKDSLEPNSIFQRVQATPFKIVDRKFVYDFTKVELEVWYYGKEEKEEEGCLVYCDQNLVGPCEK